MCIEESFDTIFIMGYGGAYNAPPPMDYGSGKSAMDERVKKPWLALQKSIDWCNKASMKSNSSEKTVIWTCSVADPVF